MCPPSKQNSLLYHLLFWLLCIFSQLFSDLFELTALQIEEEAAADDGLVYFHVLGTEDAKRKKKKAKIEK